MGNSKFMKSKTIRKEEQCQCHCHCRWNEPCPYNACPKCTKNKCPHCQPKSTKEHDLCHETIPGVAVCGICYGGMHCLDCPNRPTKECKHYTNRGGFTIHESGDNCSHIMGDEHSLPTEVWEKDYRHKYEGANVWSSKAIDSQIEDIKSLLLSQKEELLSQPKPTKELGIEDMCDNLEEHYKDTSHRCKPPLPTEAWEKEFDRKFDQVEFLHGVPVSLPLDTRIELKQFISSLLLSQKEELRRKTEKIKRTGLTDTDDWSIGYRQGHTWTIDAILKIMEGGE